MSKAEIKKADFAQTLARGLACLEALSASDEPMSASEVSAIIDVHRASARRILLTLASLDYVAEISGRFMLTPHILTLGRSLFSRNSLWSTVNGVVVSTANALDEPCSVSVLEGLDILFVCRDATRRIYTSRLGVGDRLPAYCSASGKVLLSALPEPQLDELLSRHKLTPRGPKAITNPEFLKKELRKVSSDGYAVAIDEMEAGTLSIAVSLRERNGAVVAAMAIATHRSRITPEKLRDKFLSPLLNGKDRVEMIIRDYQDRGWATF